MNCGCSKNVKIYVQVSTFKNFNEDYVKILNDKKTVCVRAKQDFYKERLKDTPNFWIFTTNEVFCNEHPDLVYKTVSEDLIPSILQGTHVTFLGFGQTGTGKSTTMHGLKNFFTTRGLSVRILEDLINLQNKLKRSNIINYEVSCVEIQKDYIIDLLTDNCEKTYRPFKNFTKLPVNCLEDAWKYLFSSETRRSCNKNTYYLSHGAPSIFTVFVKIRSVIENNLEEKYSKIHIIDMSGADTLGNETCIKRTKKDVGNSNLCKTHLEQLLLYFNHHQVTDSKLLRGWGSMVEYLNDSLKPNNLLRFIAHIFTTKVGLPLTLSHLRFMQLALTMNSNTKKIEVTRKHNEIEEHLLKKYLKFFFEQEHLRTMILNDDAPIHLTKDKFEQTKRILNDFIANNINTIDLKNWSDTQSIFNIFREMYLDHETEIQRLQQERTSKVSVETITDLVDSTSKASKMSQCTFLKNNTTRTQRKSGKNHRDKSKTAKRSAIPNISPTNLSPETKSPRILKTLLPAPVSTKTSNIDTISAKSRKSKPKSKSSSKSSFSSKTATVIVEDNDNLANYLQVKTDYEDFWNEFTQDEVYLEMYESLKTAANEYLDVLNNYNEIMTEMRNKSEELNATREYLFKVLSLRYSRKIKKCYTKDHKKIDEIEADVKAQLDGKINEMTELNEELLTKQAELKINIDNYHRIKKEIGEYFINYCRENFNVSLGLGHQDQYLDDDDLLSPEKNKLKSKQLPLEDDLRKKEKYFYYLQGEMNKILNENNYQCCNL